MNCLKNAAIGLVALAVTPVALAEQQHQYLTKDHFVYAGVFDQGSSATLMAQRGDFEPIKIDFTNVGLAEDYTSWMLEYHFRLSERWRISAAAYRFTQGAGKTLETAFNFDGVEYEVGVDVRSKINVDTYILDAMYTVYQDSNAEISVGAGIHALDSSLRISAVADINGQPIAESERASASVLAPLPNLRASGFYAFNEDWSVWATVGWLSANIDNIEGSFEYAHLRGQYQITDGLGLSLGYQYVGVDVQENRERGTNLFDLEFTGLTAAVSYAF